MRCALSRPEIILAIDTSAAHCAAALLFSQPQSGQAKAFRITARAEDMAKGQAERLPGMVGALMADEGTFWPDLTGLAVGTGPGNFTGIRIAVAYARGLSLGLGIPAAGVTAFQAIARAHEATPLPYWVVMEAPRGEHYVQRFPNGAASILGPEGLDTLDAPLLHRSALSAQDLVTAIAQHAFANPAVPGQRPAPFYLRGADAAPPSDLPPVILP